MASWNLPDINKFPSPFDEDATRRLIESSVDMQATLQKKLNEIGNQRIGVRDPFGARGLHPVLMVGLLLLLLAAVIRLCVQCCRCCKRRSQEPLAPAPAPAPASAPATAPVFTSVSVPPSYNALPHPPAYDSVRLLPDPGDCKPASC